MEIRSERCGHVLATLRTPRDIDTAVYELDRDAMEAEHSYYTHGGRRPAWIPEPKEAS